MTVRFHQLLLRERLFEFLVIPPAPDLNVPHARVVWGRRVSVVSYCLNSLQRVLRGLDGRWLVVACASLGLFCPLLLGQALWDTKDSGNIPTLSSLGCVARGVFFRLQGEMLSTGDSASAWHHGNVGLEHPGDFIQA